MPHADPEKRREYQRKYKRAYRKTNAAYQEWERQYRKRYCAENRDKRRELQYKWRRENPERWRQIKGANERKRHSGSAISKHYQEELAEWYSNRPEDHHVDHIIPLNGDGVCGLHVPWNLQYLPSKENLSKSNDWSDYYEGSDS